MAEALRELLAKMVIEVDDSAVKRGNTAVDALKAKAESAAKSIQAIGRPMLGWGKQMSDLFAGMGIRSRGPAPGMGAWGSALGAQIQAGVQANRATRDAEAAAAAYAQTLRGRLAPAAAAFRASFGAPSGEGPGVVGALKSAWGWATSLRTAFLGLGAGFAVRSLARVVDEVGGIGEAAAKLGVTTDEFQRLNVLAKNNATDVGALGTAFRNLAKLAYEPTKDSAAAFAQLGVATKDANGQLRPTNDLFFDAAEALADVDNEGKRSALALQLFGRSSTELKALLANGSEGIRQQREELAKLAVISRENIAQADQLGDTFNGVWSGLRAKLINEVFPRLLPYLERFVSWLGSPEFDRFVQKAWRITKAIAQFVGVLVAGGAVRWLTNFAKTFGVLVKLSGGLGPALGGVAGSVAKLGLSVAKALGPLLILEDFIVFLLGGDSLIGRGLDKLFGKGASLEVFYALEKVLSEIVAHVRQALIWAKIIEPDPAGGPQPTGLFGAAASEFADRGFADAFGDADPQGRGALDILTDALTVAFSSINGTTPGNSTVSAPQTNNITLNVGSTSEVQPAINGALRGVQARGPLADAAAANWVER